MRPSPSSSSFGRAPRELGTRLGGARSRLLIAAGLAIAVGSSGCHGCQDAPIVRHHDAGPEASASLPDRPPAPVTRVVFDIGKELAGCDVDHRGVLLDLGTDAMVGRFGWRDGVPVGLETVEHDGATWSRVYDKKIELSFVQLDSTPIFVSTRVIGHGSKSALVTLDDQSLGTLSFARDQIKTASTGTTALPVDPGLHTIALRFSGRPRSESDGFAEVDWVRIGVPDDSAVVYGPPTLQDVITPAAALGGFPHRAISLRPPADLRCALRVPPGARLRAAIGLSGVGEADAELRVLRDGKKADVLQQVHVTGGDHAAWTDVDVSLAAYTSEVVSLELGAVDGSHGTRVLFGDPAVVTAQIAPPPVQAARAAIVVVLDGVDRAELPPWNPGARAMLPTLADLALVGATFDRHRAPSTVVASVVASMLTGLSPRAHGLVDTFSRLPGTTPTIAALARDASVSTAMFTGVPFTFKPFGFGDAWTRFVQHSPTSGDPATAPLDDAANWIGEALHEVPDTRLFAVVHARGGHPPWDVTAKELALVPPADYTGPIEPRRAAQMLAKLRLPKKHASALASADRDRVQALEAIGMAGQDRALGTIVAALKTANLWDATLFIVTGDVGSGASDAVPFADGLPLSESELGLPLYVHFPGGSFAGLRSSAPTEIFDVSRTVAGALGLVLPKDALGRDLASVAGGGEGAILEPQVATLGETYSARWGEIVLAGRQNAPPSMCDLELDPTCAFNRRETMPLSTQALFRRFVARDARRTPVEKREPATLDADTWANLDVWGAKD